MPIRKVKQYSDRGKIKDLTNKQESEAPLLPSELRLQKLYEYASKNNNHNVLKELGFITTDYIDDKNALPLTVYRIRQIVADIKSKSPKIDQYSVQLSKLFGIEHTLEADAYWSRKMVKNANCKLPIFRRVK